jgi:hypothetical protein
VTSAVMALLGNPILPQSQLLPWASAAWDIDNAMSVTSEKRCRWVMIMGEREMDRILDFFALILAVFRSGRTPLYNDPPMSRHLFIKRS